MNWYLLVRFVHIFWFDRFHWRDTCETSCSHIGQEIHRCAYTCGVFLATDKIESLMLIPGDMIVIIFGVILAIMVRAPIFGFLQGSSHL